MEAMRIGLDAHALGRRQTGNETYVLGLLHGLTQIGFPVHAYGYGEAPGGSHQWRRLHRRSRWLRLVVDTPLAAARNHLDLYHGIWALPPVMSCRSVVTVHDLSFLFHPEWLPRSQAMVLRHTVDHALRKAAHVITISERTRQDIVEWSRIVPEDRITVTHLAPRPELLPAAVPVRRNTDYFLYVGTITPRKNVALLVRALAVLRDRGIEVPLVLAGRPGAADGDVHCLTHRLGLGHLVRFTGYISDRELRDLYAGCTALVHPSLYEGFGLTPLEAMAHGRPALVADAGSLPEVVGDAGMLLPPDDAEVWAHAMESVLSPAVNTDLGEKGRRRAAEFSWERCARQTVDVYSDSISH